MKSLSHALTNAISCWWIAWMNAGSLLGSARPFSSQWWTPSAHAKQHVSAFLSLPYRQTEQNTKQIVRTGDELERTQRRVGTVGRIGAVGRVAPPGVGLAVDDREAVGRDVEPPKLIDVRDIRPLGDGEVLAGRVGLSTAVRIAAAICARERGGVRACRSARRTPWSGG